VYGYPVEEGARIALVTVADYLRGDTSLTLARFVLRPDTYPAFERALAKL
jgi:O-acetyl-ADP-ribose deacetylase (regulator of RNase III)